MFLRAPVGIAASLGKCFGSSGNSVMDFFGCGIMKFDSAGLLGTWINTGEGGRSKLAWFTSDKVTSCEGGHKGLQSLFETHSYDGYNTAND